MTASLHYMPVTIATCIEYTSVIVTVYLAWFFLKEKFYYYDILCLLAALLGVLIINNIFGDRNSSEEETLKSKNYLLGTVLLLLGGLCNSTANLQMRMMKTAIHYSVTPFWYSITCAFLGGALYSTEG